MDPIMWIVLLGMVVLFWLMIVRPQAKRLKEQQAAVSQVIEGNRVLLQSGIIGTIVHLGTKQMIVEIAPGVEITCDRRAILSPVDPADEEFEYELTPGAEPEVVEPVPTVLETMDGPVVEEPK